MGLCKCPKRQVTTQFCFEHRVNVCENCMVVNHTKCTVQSYIQWLKDSDYDSNCTLCGSPRDSDDCVRLICYHVFHWKCLNARQQLLPPNTAPGGHTCPICSDPIFPPGNLVSPVADVLRVRLGQANWGRNELGLPLLLDEKRDHSKSFPVSSTTPIATSSGLGNDSVAATNGAAVYGGVHSGLAQMRAAGSSVPLLSGKERPDSPHSIVNLDQYVNVANSRRTNLLSREPPIGGSDRDDNKYKRRTPQEIFSRWSRRLYAPSARPIWRKNWFLVVTGLIAIVCIVYIMAEITTADRSGSDQHGFIPNRNLPHAEE
ncbi:zinc finger protein-like 1 homolog [Anopheles ziemanni]|uniref:zinc finger protein-like 1 homolog n=1 Tax=Anopheles coustani TaxID=139045 RepID=UPI0026597668|nr:zinc finger protein-like 1 homolog [Anopheles coustani]XP_058175945.1 zinc finger protein-like 1 homolog [Anopheles ziemanni]